MVGRHDNQRRIFSFPCCPKRSQGQRRRRIASKRFEQNPALLTQQANLLGHHKTMLLVANKYRTSDIRETIHSLDSFLQHRIIADKRQELLRVLLP
jgi:hypothetical protein